MAKICSKCRENKPLNAYSKNALGKKGRRPDCKSCVNANAHLVENRQKRQEYDKKYYLKHKKKIQIKQEKYRAKNKLYFSNYKKQYNKTEKGKVAIVKANHNKQVWKSKTLNNFDAKEGKCILFLQNYKCIYPECNEYFDLVKPTLDHINPLSKGGPLVKDNVQYLCQKHNSKKHTQEIDYRSDMHKEIMKSLNF